MNLLLLMVNCAAAYFSCDKKILLLAIAGNVFYITSLKLTEEEPDHYHNQSQSSHVTLSPVNYAQIKAAVCPKWF